MTVDVPIFLFNFDLLHSKCVYYSFAHFFIEGRHLDMDLLQDGKSNPILSCTSLSSSFLVITAIFHGLLCLFYVSFSCHLSHFLLVLRACLVWLIYVLFLFSLSGPHYLDPPRYLLSLRCHFFLSIYYVDWVVLFCREKIIMISDLVFWLWIIVAGWLTSTKKKRCCWWW